MPSLSAQARYLALFARAPERGRSRQKTGDNLVKIPAFFYEKMGTIEALAVLTLIAVWGIRKEASRVTA